MIVTVKVGTSSLTDADGRLNTANMHDIAFQIAEVRADGNAAVLVTSGAVAAGLPALGLDAHSRPRDTRTLQAIAAVGQARLAASWNACFDPLGIVTGQMLLLPTDFTHRGQYLHARDTLERLLELGVLPVVNENDAVAHNVLRFGDNDRIAALVAQALQAELLLLLTDTPGLLTADPRVDRSASLIEEIIEIDRSLEELAGGAGSERGSGGMMSKLAAAKMAAWTGVRTVIAQADRRGVIRDAISGENPVGTTIHPRPKRLSAWKVWIAFAMRSEGTVVVDAGARNALVNRGGSLLVPGIRSIEGSFTPEAAVEIVGPGGDVFAKGITRLSSTALSSVCFGGSRDDREGSIAVHRDDLVVLPG